MTNEPNCRQKRQKLGLSYPRSSCNECGSVIREGWECPYVTRDRKNLLAKCADELRAAKEENATLQVKLAGVERELEYSKHCGG
jgi:hypothetical protein